MSLPTASAMHTALRIASGRSVDGPAPGASFDQPAALAAVR